MPLNERCAKCNYDLTGLPGMGKCPECGNVYNTLSRQGLWQPESVAERSERILAWLKIGSLFGVGLFILVCSGLLTPLSSRGQAIWIGGLFALCFFVAGAAALAQYLIQRRQK